MSRADKRRRRLQAHRQAARGEPAVGQPCGAPTFAPTPERLRRGEVVIQQVISAGAETSARDWTGQRATDGSRPMVIGHVRRDLASSAAHRLSRFRDLEPRQVAAARRLEQDWEISGLEPRMTADLASLGIGGGRGGLDLRDAVVAARQRLHAARAALRRGGGEVLRIVEGLVILDAATDDVGAPVYTGRRDASVYVRTLLGVGLNLLADHYAPARA